MKARTAQSKAFATHDGEELFYRVWPALSGTPRGAIVLLHRGHEHSERMEHLAHELGLPDFDIFAWDARGHGRSPGPRGYSPSVGTSIRDVHSFIDQIGEAHGFAHKDIAVVGQSVGAVLATAWVHDYAPDIRALVLASPAFRIKLYVPLVRPLLRLARKAKGDFFVNSYVKAKYLTHDRERIASYEVDELIARPISVDMLLGIHDVSVRIVADAAAIVTPTQLLISGSDWVVEDAPQHRFFERLGSVKKERYVLDGFYHDTLGERDRMLAIDKARTFITDCFAAEPSPPSLINADKTGYTRREADELASPLPALSPRGWYWRAMRQALKLGSYLSQGLRIGHEAGFDSGRMLDYVYKNEASGLTPAGRAIDRNYLNSVGWAGIRQRKVYIEELLHSAMARLSADGQPIRILDIAAGHGRYIIDAVSKSKHRPAAISLRDFDAGNVTAGRRLIKQQGLGDIATFDTGDAFDPASFANLDPHPSLAVVSGLYELFDDNYMIQASLGGLAEAVPDGGYLIYTCQPWHPQLELIARTLTSHRKGKPWIMRRRTQAEMDQLVAAAGFHKLEQRIDEHGIFTVCLAQRISS